MKLGSRIAVFYLFFCVSIGFAQKQYWHQTADYQMDIKVNSTDFRYQATQQIHYKNNSPDTLSFVFYHLYLNAFQAGSEMDARLQTIADPDRRMVENIGTKEEPKIQSRISQLTENQKGYIKIQSLKQNGKPVEFEVFGTILKVKLHSPILPKTSVFFQMEYEAQIPPVIRRMGRNSKDGIDFSMAQWYPKIAQYDSSGWNTTQYIAREFYGVWGDYDVKIQIDKKYILAGTGLLQSSKVKDNDKIWHFKAKNVHDFSWAADEDFKQDVVETKSGKKLRFFYKSYDQNWKKIQPKMVQVFDFFSEKIGEYPWEEYSFIQAGDGGMEYAMCTFIAGGSDYLGLVQTAIHELAHTWFQHIFSTNEALYPWVDEGFTSYIENWAMKEILKVDDPFVGHYHCYLSVVKQGIQEMPTTHADRYQTNRAYSANAYCKGAVFLSQLGYIIGQENLEKTLKRFYREFSMKHPVPQDFIRCAEKESQMQLGWYLNEFMQTTHTIDYEVLSPISAGEKTKITLKRNGRMPMPIDVQVVLKNGKKWNYHIPTLLTLGVNQRENGVKVLKDWGWAYQEYSFEIQLLKEEIAYIQIDPKNQIADTNKENNIIYTN